MLQSDVPTNATSLAPTLSERPKKRPNPDALPDASTVYIEEVPWDGESDTDDTNQEDEEEQEEGEAEQNQYHALRDSTSLSIT